MTAQEIIEKIRAEIERLKEEHQVPTFPGDEYEEGDINGYQIALDKVLAKLDTLQEQPVELEKEIEDKIRNVFFDLNGIAIAGSSAYASVEDMVYVARCFYELGRQSKEQLAGDEYWRGYENGRKEVISKPEDFGLCKEQPVCEELGREMDRFFTSEEYEEAEKAGFGEPHAARHFAQWGAEHRGSSETPKDLEESAKSRLYTANPMKAEVRPVTITLED